MAWQALNHVLGLARLGHEVYYVEDSGAPPYDPRIRSVVADPAYGIEFLRRTMDRYGLGGRWAYHDLVRGEVHGLSAARLRALYGEVDAVVNLCGATRLREEHLRCPVRIYVETDPVYEQIRIEAGHLETVTALDAHTHHFTYGENLGQPDCPIPLPRYAWHATRPPVVLEHWTPGPAPAPRCFTTVATWENVGKDVSYRGETYRWSKHVNFLKMLDLPRLTPQPLELALAFRTADETTTRMLSERGWILADAETRSRDTEVYRAHIQGSRGEFTVAKDSMARTRSGWFSDRSVCYLAAGRPVVTLETGFSKFVPAGRGLVAFETVEEAAAAIDEVNRDYAGHCRAARAVAAESFESDGVLGRLCRDADL
ncbi:MAG: hypothetical protein L0027_05840 [Candidatus Rokubacteria bacterium]|nr:hypothetical protein [Candidatus Rokubacteria bacterium]